MRLDRRTSERVSIRPVEDKGEPPLRFNWESPFIISPHSPSRLYFGANRLFRSDDRGNTWRAISPDLTRQTDRNMLPVMGKVWPPEAVAQHQSTATWGNISALSESRKREGLLYVGTDDGLVQFSYDGGGTWRKSERLPGLPDYGNYGVYVQRLYASARTTRTSSTRSSRTARTATSSRTSTRAPTAARSWKSIAGDLPANGPVLAFAEDHVNPEPAVRRHRVRPVLHRRRRQEVDPPAQQPADDRRARPGDPGARERSGARRRSAAASTCSTTTRRCGSCRTATFERDGHIFPSKPAVIEVPETGRARGSQGEQLWMGENRPPGAIVTYWVKDAPQTRGSGARTPRAPRRDEEGNAAYPTQAELTAEADEEAPQTFLTITDAAGKVVRRLDGARRRAASIAMSGTCAACADHGRRRVRRRRRWRRRRRR